MPQPLYPWGKNPQCPMHRRLGGPQKKSGCDGKGKKIPIFAGN